MAGVAIFTLILLAYGFLLSRSVWEKVFPKAENFFKKLNDIMSNQAICFFLAVGAIVFGVWNFFAPDFGEIQYGPTVLGALLPSILLILNGFTLYPKLIEIINITEEKKNKFINFVNKFNEYAGLITLLFAILHIVIGKMLLF